MVDVGVLPEVYRGACEAIHDAHIVEQVLRPARRKPAIVAPPPAPYPPGMQLRHIALASDWESARATGEYRVSTVGRSIDDEGFIHASLPEQVAATGGRYYAGLGVPLVVLVMDSDRLEAAGVPVRLEEAGGELFPHLYAPLPVELVDDVRPATFGPDGDVTF